MAVSQQQVSLCSAWALLRQHYQHHVQVEDALHSRWVTEDVHSQEQQTSLCYASISLTVCWACAHLMTW